MPTLTNRFARSIYQPVHDPWVTHNLGTCLISTGKDTAWANSKYCLNVSVTHIRLDCQRPPLLSNIVAQYTNTTQTAELHKRT